MSKDRSRGAAFLVAAGILLSRIAGLIRQKIFAHYFSTSLAADAFHPGPQIYGAWAEVIAEALERRRGAVSRRAGPTGA